MDGFDDDDRAAAYQRFIFNEFADIVHNYDRTAHVDHDDIVYDQHDLDHLDGAEYDDNGDPVVQYGLVFFIFRPSDDAPFDYDNPGDNDRTPDNRCTNDDGAVYDDPQTLAERFFAAWAEADDYECNPVPDNFYRFPLYNPRRGPCKRPYGFFYTSRDFPRPPA